jgi:uroporphyrinogen decarboxylase
MERTQGPNFERLRRALLLQGEPDRVPLLELTVDQQVQNAFLGGEKSGLAGQVEFWVKAGYDHFPIPMGLGYIITNPAGFRHMRPGDPALAAFASLGKAKKSRYSLYQEADSERVWREEGRGVVTSLEEFQRFPWPSPQDLDYSILDQVAELLPPGMKAIARFGNGFPEIEGLMGTEAFYVSLFDNPELVAWLFEKIGSIEYEAMERVVQHPAVGAIWVTGDIAYSQGLLVSPKVLRQYVFPQMKRMAALCHERDLPFMYHSDGDLSEVIDDLIDCGIDALHPIEPKAMDIAGLKKKYGHKLCLCGNIDLGYTLTLGTPEEVAEEVKQRLREIAPGGGYCCGSSNSVTEYVPMANFNAMRETVLHYGGYPISV